MTANDLVQLGLYLLVLLAPVEPLGAYMARVFADSPNRITRFGAPVERFIYRIAGIRADEDMGWTRYALALLAFNVAGLLVVYLLQRVQPWLPLNPQGFPAVVPDSAMNTAISFATNTDWQGYGGESTMSYLTQMLGLSVQNFLSAATGVAVLMALIRGFARHNAHGVGNFWVDVTRCTLYVLLPLALLLALLLSWQGVPQDFRPYASVPLLQPMTQTATARDSAGKEVTRETPVTAQLLPLGPVASQVAIKQLGIRSRLRGPCFAFACGEIRFPRFFAQVLSLVVLGATALLVASAGGQGDRSDDDDRHDDDGDDDPHQYGGIHG